MGELSKEVWWNYLGEDLQKLLNEAVLLSETYYGKEDFHDYAFVVFPAAKAYEGFLKKLFLDLEFITPQDYYGKHFRIGKALNPSLEKSFRSESVYDKLVAFTGTNMLADTLWDTWKNCRNLVFHWFPNEKNALSVTEAKERVDMVIKAIGLAYKECKMKGQ
ncbi:hypothetical protein MUP46_04105 [Patescibacteria group bacterium]|nr:hypothetical protein [Patescibacteria group bacterium]